MALYHIDELKKISHDDKFISVGATVTLSEFERYVEKLIPELKQMLHIFASPQIKNQGTLVGNVVNASPIADTIPYLMASDARVVLKSVKGERDVLMSDFYLGYKKLDMDPSEIVIGIKIPLPKKSEQTRLYKVSVRRDLDISAVTFAGMIEVEKGTIKNARIAMGGVAATVLRLKEIENKLQGMDFNRKTFEEAAAMMPTLINPLSDLRASKEYRMLLAKNFFLKFHNDIAEAKV